MIFNKQTLREKKYFTADSTTLINQLLYRRGHNNTEVDRDFVGALYDALVTAKTRYESYLWWLQLTSDLRRLEGQIAFYEELLETGKALFSHQEVIESVFDFLVQTETSFRSKLMYSCLMKTDILTLLQEKSLFKGHLDPDLQAVVNHSYTRYVLAILGVVFFLLVSVLAPPIGFVIVANAVFAASSAFMVTFFSAGLESYFTANSSLPSMILGHDYMQFSVMKSNDKKAQTAAWAAIESASRAYFAATIYFVAVLVLSIFFTFNPWPLTLLLIVSPVIQLTLELLLPFYRYSPGDLNQYLSDYQKQGVANMHLTDNDKIGWLKSLKRQSLSKNAFFVAHGLSLVGLSLGMVFAPHIPLLALSVVINTVAPIILIGTITGIVVMSAIYLKNNKNKQCPNRFAITVEQLELDPIPDKKLKTVSPFYHSRWLFKKNILPKTVSQQEEESDDNAPENSSMMRLC